jgi:hypothetical protein
MFNDMQLVLEILLAAILCGSVIGVILIVKNALSMPVPKTDGAEIFTVVAVKGGAEQLEQTVKGLLWFDKSGIVKSRIVIADCGLLEESRKVAELLARDSDFVMVCLPDEIPQILEENGWTTVAGT